MIFKIFAKAYELFLHAFRPVPIEYFCQEFLSRPYQPPKIMEIPCSLDIFIPFRDKWNLTQLCLEALLKQNLTGLQLAVHLIDNGSSDATKHSLNHWLNSHSEAAKFFVHHSNEPFNFSKLCNVALTQKCESRETAHFLFLNNDVILDNTEALRQSIGFLKQNRDCGALGITLLYPDRSIQHLFAAPGVKIIAAHPYKGKSPNLLGEWDRRARRVPAITGAYLMVPAQYFHEVGGFDENLPTTGQDIDLCMKLQERGWDCWVLPTLQATHYESASRKHSRINRTEVDYIYAKWEGKLRKHPGYPGLLSRWSEQPAKRIFEGRYPYHFIV